MSRTTRKRSRWGKVRGWHNHSLGCWDAEWAEYKLAAELSNSKSVNAWMRSWLNEAVRYDKMQAKEKDEQ